MLFCKLSKKIYSTFSAVFLATLIVVNLLTPAQALTREDCDRIYDTDAPLTPFGRGLLQGGKSSCYSNADSNDIPSYLDIPIFQPYNAQQRANYLQSAIYQLELKYYNQTGKVIPVTQDNVKQVMNIIGANASEAQFVINQMRRY